MNRSVVSCCIASVVLFLSNSESTQAFDWEILRLDQREGFMHSTSLAVGPDGRVYVSYVYATNPPSTSGDVYVAIREGGVWSQTLVSGSFSGYGTRLAVNPVTGMPGVLFQSNAGGGIKNLEFWEYDGAAWIRQDTLQLRGLSLQSLAYSATGEAHVGYTVKTTLEAESVFLLRVMRRTGVGWQDVPIPFAQGWLNLARQGNNIVAAGTSHMRGVSGLRWLDATRLLPGSFAIDTIDQLPSEALDGEVSVRVPGLATSDDGTILLAYCSKYTIASEDFVEVTLAQFDGEAWSQPEVVLGGGSISDPAAYGQALPFAEELVLAMTEDGLPFIFGSDYGSLNVAYLQAGVWQVDNIDAAGECGGLWRGRAAGIDPETNTPIVAYVQGAGWQVDSAVHVARVIPATGDADGSGAVDLTDHGALASCANGPNVLPSTSPSIDECLATFDFNLDGDVDLQDFGEFEMVFSLP